MAAIDTVLGIDIGGTTTSFGFVTKEGRCLVDITIPTGSHEQPPAFIERLWKRVQEARSSCADELSLLGIGVGAPNANFYTGMVESPPNLDWGESVNLAGLFRRRFDLPTVITNDANAAAIGELLFGGGRGMKHFIVITLGTGLGSGIVVNGNILYGADGFAGELGHTVVDPDGRRCGCGKRGCLETYVSAPGVCRTVSALLAEHTAESRLRAVSFQELTAEDVFRAALDGDTIAREAFEMTGRILGMKLADAVMHTSPQAFFFTGGLAAAGDLLLDPARRSMETHLLRNFRGNVQLLPSSLQDVNGAVLGAGALAWHHLVTPGNQQ